MPDARPFVVYPCVDVQRGRAVRLTEGDPDRETVYFEDPRAAAAHWVGLGARDLHVVDLDAAIGSGDNRAVIREAAAAAALAGARVEVGGGVRSLEVARAWLRAVHRVVLGTVALGAEHDAIDESMCPAGQAHQLVHTAFGGAGLAQQDALAVHLDHADLVRAEQPAVASGSPNRFGLGTGEGQGEVLGRHRRELPVEGLFVYLGGFLGERDPKAPQEFRAVAGRGSEDEGGCLHGRRRLFTIFASGSRLSP